MSEPDGQLGSVEQEARTCPVCGTKFFATADRQFCPVCILRRAFGAEPAAAGEPGPGRGSADSAEEADGGSQVRRFENYEVKLGRRWQTDRVGSRGYGGHLQGVRRRSALPRDAESHQRAIPW